jgi:hypothetical protein
MSSWVVKETGVSVPPFHREIRAFRDHQGAISMETAATNGHILIPSDDGSISYTVSAPPLAERMERLSFYDTIRCSTCGQGWADHDPACSQHFRCDEMNALFVECVLSGKYKGEHLNAVRNGPEESCSLGA